MQIIRTDDELVGAAAQSPCAEYAQILQGWHDRLADYELAEVAVIALTRSTEELSMIEHQTGHQLRDDDGAFRPVEIAAMHQRLIELVFILSDDGFGMVLLVPTDAEPALLALCEQTMP